MTARYVRRFGPRLRPVLEPGERLLDIALVKPSPPTVNKAGPIVGEEDGAAKRFLAVSPLASGLLCLSDRRLWFSPRGDGPTPLAPSPLWWVGRAQVAHIEPSDGRLGFHFLLRFTDGSALRLRTSRHQFHTLAAAFGQPQVGVPPRRS